MLSPGERAALRLFVSEWQISRNHRRGVRLLCQTSRLRPARLNLGAGGVCKEGFLNVDLFPGSDVTLDLRRGLPFESDCCDLIVTEHFLEHLEYPEQVSLVLRECLRVLRPGGTVRLSVPDTAWPLSAYHEGIKSPYFQACREQPWGHPEQCETRLEFINHHFYQRGEHRFAYDWETLEKLLVTVGFQKVTKCGFDPTLDAAHRRLGSLFVSAYKQP